MEHLDITTSTPRAIITSLPIYTMRREVCSSKTARGSAPICKSYGNHQAEVVSTKKPSSKEEECILTSFFHVMPLVILYLLALACGLYISLLFPALTMIHRLKIGGVVLLIQIPLALLPAFLLLLKSCLSLCAKKLILSSRQLGIVTSIGSWVCRKDEVSYSAVAYVGVQQSVYGRLLNIGSIAVGRSSGDEAELLMCGVFAPNKLAKALRVRVYENQTR